MQPDTGPCIIAMPASERSRSGISDGDHHRACVLGAHAFEFEQIGSEFLDHRGR